MYKGNFHPYRNSPAFVAWMAASIPVLEAVSGLAASPDPEAVSGLAASPDPGAASGLAASPDPGAVSDLAASPDPEAVSDLAASPDPEAVSDLAASPDPGAVSDPEAAGPVSWDIFQSLLFPGFERNLFHSLPPGPRLPAGFLLVQSQPPTAFLPSSATPIHFLWANSPLSAKGFECPWFFLP